MSDILATGLSVAGGGFTGIFGGLLGRVAGFFERKQTFKHELALKQFKAEQDKREMQMMDKAHDHEINLMRMNIEADAKETEAEISLANVHGSWEGLEASYEHDKSVGTASQWVIDGLRCVRPILTLFLWLLVPLLILLKADISIINSALYAGTAATMWWFGDRGRTSEIKHIEAVR